MTTRALANSFRAAVTDEDIALLGTELVDVCLNDRAFCKWLSYRDRAVLGRDLSVGEVRQFTSICLRVTQLVVRYQDTFTTVLEWVTLAVGARQARSWCRRIPGEDAAGLTLGCKGRAGRPSRS